MNSIIKPKRIDVDAQILAMYLLYATRPGNAEPDDTGRYFIGDVEDAPERTFQRWSPYSLAEPSK
jgi:hypothetical protein